MTCIPNREPLAPSDTGCSIRPPLVATSLLWGVSVADLRYCNQYREGDYIVYDDWLGRVQVAYEEVKIRLGNNSLAIVKDPMKLKDPRLSFTSDAYRFHHHLVIAGYKKFTYPPDLTENSTAKSCFTQPCFPGLVVQTDEENIFPSERGTSEDDPSTIVAKSVGTGTMLTGTVVEVRCKALEISWVASNIFNQHRALKRAPPCVLDHRILDGRLVRLYDRNRMRINPDLRTLTAILISRTFRLASV